MTLQLQVLQLSQKKLHETASLNWKSITQRLVVLVTNVVYQTNIEVHYTSAISKH